MKRRRNKIEAAIERHLEAAQDLIQQLDAMDSDSDLEPSLGAPEPTFNPEGDGDYHRRMLGQDHWARGGTGDREEEEGV